MVDGPVWLPRPRTLSIAKEVDQRPILPSHPSGHGQESQPTSWWANQAQSNIYPPPSNPRAPTDPSIPPWASHPEPEPSPLSAHALDQRMLDQEVLKSSTKPQAPDQESGNTTSDEDDPLVSTLRMEPFRMMTHREENKRLREEGHAAPHNHGGGSHHEHTPSDTYRNTTDEESRKSKRAKTTPGERDGTYDSAGRLVQKKGDTSTTFLDPVHLGLCSEMEGRQMFDRSVPCLQ
jgi:hypothetical protein